MYVDAKSKERSIWLRYCNAVRGKCFIADIKGHNCDICGLIYTLEIHLKEHVARAHQVKDSGPWSCHKCSKSYSDKDGWYQHMRSIGEEPITNTHTGEEPIANTHTGEEPISNTHTGKEPYVKTQKGENTKRLICAVCGLEFKKVIKLKQHMKEHKMRIACDIPSCNHIADSYIDLKKHKRDNHTGEKTVQSMQLYCFQSFSIK